MSDVYRAGGQWHLDKRIPIAIIVAILVNSGLGVWYASKLDSRVTAVELAEARDAVNIAMDEKDVRAGSDRLIRVEDKIDQIRELLRIFDSSSKTTPPH